MDPSTPLLLLLSVQFGVQPLLTRAVVSPGTPNSSLVLAAESIKVALAVVALILAGADRDAGLRTWNLGGAVARAGVPAALYSLTNWLLLLAAKNLPPLTLSLLNQTKTLSAAFWAYVLLGKAQTPPQVLALVILAMGAYLVVAADSTGITTTTPADGDVVVGVVSVLTASMLSGVASALTERALSRSLSPALSFIYSLELALFGIATMLASLVLGLNPDQAFFRHPLQGWTWATLVPCATTALGGLLVGLVTQRAGGVRKGFALIAGICMTTLMEGLLGWRKLVPMHVVAVALVCVSMWLHAWGGRKAKVQ